MPLPRALSVIRTDLRKRRLDFDALFWTRIITQNPSCIRIGDDDVTLA